MANPANQGLMPQIYCQPLAPTGASQGSLWVNQTTGVLQVNTGDSWTTVVMTAQTVTAASATAFAVGPNGATNPTFVVDTSVSSEATGILVTGAAAAGGVTIAAISSGSNETLTISAKGAGVFVLTTPSAPASVGGATGTNAGTALSLIGGVGGASSIVTTGAGGVGGGLTFTGGAGGTAALAATAGTGGAGGAITLTTGAGAASAVTGSGTGAGGAGGLFTIRGGVGGATSTSTGGNTGGAGGGVSLIAGAGGNAASTAGTDTGGAGGVVTITPGAGGTGDANAAGRPGYVNITTGITRRSVQTIDMADTALVLTLIPGTPVGTLMTSDILYVDANSSGTENLDLPPEADLTGIVLVIVNTGGETINIRNDAGGAVLTLETANTAIVTSDGTTLRGFVGIP